MYALAFFSVALALAGSVFSLVIPRQTAPSGWLTDVLQPYQDYHARYQALDCAAKHNTTFFDQCCHPLLKNEPISALPAQCNPANLPTTSSDAADPDCTDDADDNDEPTTTVESDDPDCTDDGDDGQVDSTSSQTPTSTSKPTTSTSKSTSTSTSTSTIKSTSTTPKSTSTSKPTSSSKPTSTQKSSSTQKTSSSAKPSNTPAANIGSAPSSSSQVFSDGVATFFFQNGVAGACGQVHSDQDLIAAIDADRYGDTGKVSPLCGQQVHITNKNNGKSVVVTIRDACPTCKNRDSIDLSVGAFTQIATEEEGEVDIDWFFL